MLSHRAGCLISPHVPERIGALLHLTQASKSRHVDARARWPGRTRWSGITRRTLEEGKSKKWDLTEIEQHTDSFGCRLLFSWHVTYSRTRFSRASTRSRRSNGAGLSISSIFASRSGCSRGSLQNERMKTWKAVSLSELGLFCSKCKTLLFLQIHSEVWIIKSDKGNQMHQQFLSITLRPFALLCMKNICMVTFPFIFLIMLSA